MKFKENDVVTLNRELKFGDIIYPIGSKCIIIHAYKYNDIYEVELCKPYKIIRLQINDFQESDRLF